MNQNLGKYLIIGGLILIVVGSLVYFLCDKLNWLGKLPGDIRYENGNTKIYFPVATMILLSLLLNLVLYLIKRFF
ncbi:DUF2905 domain-containing protein [Jiulongibacter sediminis]|uniref:DUF2905 domain-containing protein n=1 Tax=Jiulongibacter sediminis TaxID=1605367 RepID=A0A0P7BNU6_9BACT|nr:DUF2905 domain-containing protein [Jiulongibacter sediminis]KPM46954.1 hypothetical protein AFM12_17130 [Jiulongibacter sediminis]TBX22300.1 hypothetical protein TK44_17135 [Jiulongibacter sediminis]